jgi:hypothetical protein
MRWNIEPVARPGRSLRSTRSRRALRPADLLESLEARALLAVDLSYSALAVANNALPGGTITVNSTIDNSGDTDAADAFDVKFYLSQNDTFESGNDTLLGTFNNAVTIPASGNRGFPIDLTIPGGTAEGNWFIIGVADSEGAVAETNEGNNNHAGAFFVGNTAPAIGATSVSPSTVGTNGIFTLRAFNVSDADNITGTLTVRFFYDDGDMVFSEVGDTLIGNATLLNGVYTFKGNVPGNVTAGAGNILVVAGDGLDNTVAIQPFTAVVAASPTLGDLTGPATARRGRGITLTASEIVGMTPSVEFFRDSNGNGTFEAGQDEFLAVSDDFAEPTKTLDLTIDPAWGAADQKFFARAIDSLGQPSNVEDFTVDLLTNRRPTVGRLLVSATTLSKGQQLTLTARNVRDDDGPETVRFYRESSGNSTLNPAQDTLLGEGTRVGSSNNWTLTLTVPTSFANGLNRFYVRAVDIVGVESFTKTAVATITRNDRPSIDAFNINKNTVASGGRVQFLAQRVTDNANIDRVEFWFDANDNGRFDAGADRLITTGVKLGASNNFRRRINLPGDLPTGAGTYFAVAFDNLGVRGAVKSDTLTIT